MRSRALHLGIAWAGFVALIALHLDVRRPPRATLHFGWLPDELAWRLLWMGLAFLYLLHYTARVWPEGDE